MDLARSRLGIREHEDLKPHTTFGVGGVARYFAEVSKAKDAIETVKFASVLGIPYAILAGGSNTVFADGLINSLIIKLKTPNVLLADGTSARHMKEYVAVDGREVVCDASVRLIDLIQFAARSGLSGLESLSGIPGSVGGAVVGNAGAYGQTVSGPLKEVEIFDGQEVRWLARDECQFAYKESIFKKKPWLLLSVRFLFNSGSADDLQRKFREIIEVRNRKFSPEMKCPGSFFKNVLMENVPGDSLKFLPRDRDYYGKIPAWFFLDAVGARGMSEGGIRIADFHGNLLINDGGATFKSVVTLAEKLKKMVREKFGIELEEEVRYVGN